MILIADSGSTKTSWCLLNSTSDVQHFTTAGINPYHTGQEEIIVLLQQEFQILKDKVSEIYFYGAGCTVEKSPLVKEALNRYFGTDLIEVNSDLLGAARSLCHSSEGIICILGTGSNSCYYDGKSIVKNVPSLGFILGDEGSGSELGKMLLSDILKNQLPEVLIYEFHKTYVLSAAEAIENVYRRPYPNRYLAGFVPFIASHIESIEMKKLVQKSFSGFIQRNVLQYEKAKELPIHFTGSIAYHFKKELEEVLESFGLKLGRISKEPMDGLISYYKEEKQL